MEMGCVDTDALTKLVDFTGLDIGEGNKVSVQSLEMVLTKAKQEKPYLFSKAAPVIRDGAPNNKVEKQETARISSAMSKEELKARAIEIDRMEGKTKNLAWG